MAIGEICNREVVSIKRKDTVTEAARLMRKHHVGSLVVVDENGKFNPVPVGILTDRDITVSVTALGLDPSTITVNEIMGETVLCVNESAGIAETVSLMRAKGVRRLPVVDTAGQLTGMVSADDLLSLLAEELSGLADATTREQRHEAQTRRTGA
jgi:CBS domain-containing protein